MLEFSRVCRSFGGVAAVSDCSFTAPRGKVTALIGPNGAGKTTLLDLCSGVTPIDSGRVAIDGVDLSRLSADAIARSGVSRTFQQPRLFNNLSARDNVLLSLDAGDGDFWKSLLGLHSNRDLTVAADEALSRVHLENHADALCRDLSYGQRKLVELARALALPHRVLLLDEPLAGVSPVIRKEVASLVTSLRRQGETILLVEHDIDFVSGVADRVVVMAAGRVIAQGTPAQVKSDKKVVEAYLG